MATTRSEAFAALKAQIEAMGLDEVVMWHCYHLPPGDQNARENCERNTMAATRALISGLDSYSDDLVAPAFQTKRVAHSTTGGLRFGGMPDVASGFVWPTSPNLRLHHVYGQFNTSGKPLIEADTPLPMTFIAQIDLAGLAGLEADLPERGRLLIFMDYAAWFEVGPSLDAPAIQILWDNTAVAALSRATPPEALIQLDKLARRNHNEFTQRMDEEFGGDAEDAEPFHSEFLPPEIPVELALEWRPAPTHGIELRRSAYVTQVDATGAIDVLGSLEEYWPSEWPDHPGPYHQLLGRPFPEQDDPRYDAVFQNLLGGALRNAEDFALMRRQKGMDEAEFMRFLEDEALNHVLLLQLDAASFQQINTEGTYYVLIHREHLEERRFDEVTVVYQQT